LAPIVNCNDLTVYTGSPNGTLTWTGELPVGGTLTVGRGLKVLDGTGALRGRDLPGCNVTLEIEPSGLRLVEVPNPANRYGRIAIQNSLKQPLSSLRIQWRTAK
jgi:hypothetical protein